MRRPSKRKISKQKRLLEREKKERGQLLVLLEKYISSHYGNPVTGRQGTIMTGPVCARLQAASSLRALLFENREL